MHNTDKVNLVMPRGRGKPKAAKLKKNKPVRLTVFVDESVKAKTDCLALIKGKTSSQLFVEAMAALMSKLPKEEIALLNGMEYRRILNKAGLGAKRLLGNEELLADSRKETELSKHEPDYEGGHDLEAEHYDPQYFEEHEAEVRAEPKRKEEK